MSIRTFWTIFIKILGIWLVLDCFSIIAQGISTVIFTNSDDDLEIFGGILISIMMTLGIYVFILWLFVFKTSWIIDQLNLEKGFTEEKIELNIERSTILNIAIIVIGGLMFINALPEFCMQILNYIQQKNMLIESVSAGWIFFHLVEIIIGYLLMTKSQNVVKFIEKQRAAQQ